MAAETRTNYYIYSIPICKILIPNSDPIDLHNDNILGFTIEKDYDNDYFPIFNLQLNLTYSQYYTIVNNKDTVRFKVRLEKTTYDEYGSSRYKEVVFDTNFSIFIEDNSSFFDKELHDKTISLLGTAENRSSYDFYLFKDTDITSSRKVINRVVDSSNMTNCIMYLLSKSGASNVLMTPLDNNSIYSDVILPPVKLIQAITYLEAHYGFYKHGTLFFYDFTTTYFINKRAECTAYRSGEFKDVIVTVFKAMNPNSKTPGNFKDSKSKTYTLHVTRDSMTMSSASIVADQIAGTNIGVINTKTNASIDVSPNITTRNSNQAYITNRFGNKYLPDIIKNNKYENDNIVDISLVDVDINCFEPNKKFILSFEDKSINVKHSGNYRLSYSLFTFIKQGDYYSVNGQIQLKKTT